MAEGYSEKLTVLDILTASTNKDQWIEETKKEIEQKERENCTFHPKTNNYDTSNAQQFFENSNGSFYAFFCIRSL